MNACMRAVCVVERATWHGLGDSDRCFTHLRAGCSLIGTVWRSSAIKACRSERVDALKLHSLEGFKPLVCLLEHTLQIIRS